MQQASTLRDRGSRPTPGLSTLRRTVTRPPCIDSLINESKRVILRWKYLCLVFSLSVLLGSPAAAQATEETATEDWNAKFQATYVWQSKRPFTAAYSGQNSLTVNKEKSYSFTATAALGARPWSDAEVYADAEVAQGVPLSSLTGLGGFTNGEMARTSGATPAFYRARLFLRQTWGFGGDDESVESDMNQLAGKLDKRRVVLTAGNLSVMDIFDGNTYSHDPRVEFLNWAIMNHGAYDFAADARGYSTGVALEYFHDNWAIRVGRFAQPRLPNQQQLNYNLLQSYGDQIELERDYSIAEQSGKLRLLAFRNVARMSRYSDALLRAARIGNIPDINQVRTGKQAKVGIGVNLEHAVTADIGVFVRAMWADGKTETYAFTEIDRSLSSGAVVNGTAWGRREDKLRVAFARNGLSGSHQDYLVAGGLGFFIGDGRLRYQPETILETFYSARVMRNVWLTLDGQFIRNPAYNADRGPVKVASMRVHVEF